MKKMIAKLIAAVMLISTVSAGAVMADGEEDLIGTWYLQSLQMEEQTIDASLIAAMGAEMTLTLNEDGTASMTMGAPSIDNQEKKGTWTSDGSAVTMAFVNDLDEESEIVFMVEGESLTLDQGGQIGIFGKEPPEAAAALAPAVENPELGDFDGTWNAASYAMFGLPVPISVLGAELSMTIEDGQVQITAVTKDLNSGEATETLTQESSAELKEDGTLFVVLEDEAVLEALQMQGSGIYLTLHEDGRMTGEIPEMVELMKQLSEMSAESESTQAQDAETAEPAENAAEGESEGDSGSSGEEAMDMYLIFEKAE